MIIDKTTKLASVNVGGKSFRISEGVTMLGDLKCTLELENKSEGLYSWTVYIQNTADKKSERISKFYGLDMKIDTNGTATLNTLRGDNFEIRSFFPESFELGKGKTVVRNPIGARSSDTTAFPYFDVVDERGEGLVAGIGWSGMWKLEASGEESAVSLRAGQFDCNFVLNPGETVRSVKILMYFGKGGADAMRQRFVRLHRKYYSPIPEFNKETYLPVSAHCFDRYYWGSKPEEGKLIYFETAEAQKEICEAAYKCKHINTFWLDACWFDGVFRTGVGNYRYAEGFKDGLKELADFTHSKGMKFILWFEPVRAQKDTDVYNKFKDDPTKIIALPDNSDYLVNLGDDEVWQYQFENIAKIIEENDVDIYRQDFNIDPIEYLRSIESPDRIGIAQMRFTEGIYRLWDALLEKFPGLLIDNCASGGRLLDVETLSRAVVLWHSDEGCRPTPAAMQNETLLLSRYLPYHQGSSFDESAYFMRSAMTWGIACEFGFLAGEKSKKAEADTLELITVGEGSREGDLYSEIVNIGEFNPEKAELALWDVMRLKEYWAGNFTALTEASDKLDAITAYSLHLEEENRGVVVAFRREEAPESVVLQIPNIIADRNYKLTFCDDELKETEQIVSGNSLIEGLQIKFEFTPGSMLVFYQAI